MRKATYGIVWAGLLLAGCGDSMTEENEVSTQALTVKATCSSNAQCSGATPVCDVASRTCVGCLTSTQCSGTKPICDTTAKACVACSTAAKCSGTSAVCLSTGACVQCSASNATACKGSTPVCNSVSNLCVASSPPACSLSASPTGLVAGGSATLSVTATGATSVSIDQGVGTLTGASVKVTPRVTTAYTLTARNSAGTCTAIATVQVGTLPVIGSFTASPATLVAGQGKSSTLSWTTSGAANVTIDHGLGLVSGAKVNVIPSATTTYTLTATNGIGSRTATVTVTVGSMPVINRFWTGTIPAGPGVSATLYWDVANATSLSIDHGVGSVSGTSVAVSPSSETTYTLTATSPIGSVTATTKVTYFPLATASSQVLYSEHSLFFIPSAGQVTWTGTNSWASIYSTANVNNYVSQLKAKFPGDYFMVVVAAANLQPNSVPNVLTYRHHADGIGQGSVTGVGVPNICRYHLGTGTVIDGAFGVFDHEIGHNWGVFIGSEVGSGHWLPNSTVGGQMADVYSDDGYATVKQIAGTPSAGFTWAAVDNLKLNESELFSDQDLYLQGLAEKFPDVYVLTSPVYKPDHTVGYTSVAKYDQAWVVGKNGVRSPTYQTSPKRFRIGFVYVARDLAEVRTVYQPIERSISHFTNAEQVDTTQFRFQVPFLVETKYRASVDTLLTDLDGNSTPTLTISGPTYLRSSNGTATVPFSAGDRDGTSPTVSCVPASTNCTIGTGAVLLSGLTSGSHFFTIKAQDLAGKKTFAHFVVDVN